MEITDTNTDQDIFTNLWFWKFYGLWYDVVENQKICVILMTNGGRHKHYVKNKAIQAQMKRGGRYGIKTAVRPQNNYNITSTI